MRQPIALDLEFRLTQPPTNVVWADSEATHEVAGPKAQLFGVVAGIRAGWCIRPFGPWMNPDPKKIKFVLRFPIIGPYLSIAIGNLGFYIGFKDFGWLPVYRVNGIWDNPGGDVYDRALTVSASWRLTRL